MPASDYVRARIDPNVKAAAAAVLASMGLTVSDACRMMLTKIARDKCLPFGTEKPNAETLQAMEDVEYGRNLHRAKDADGIPTDLSI